METTGQQQHAHDAAKQRARALAVITAPMNKTKFICKQL
jgi:hypothetical protein